ncbi:hypothetical protein ENC19_14365 [Verrucosispora sp. CWR15]|uniref:Uncharacterized protein n=1 Tax=Verrucosispora sioxanthis TaxID=2499994 RepID=A0A6M1KXX5_9ACTN|nr:hypothetical protein [Verrucosispora sioxanthis]NEE64656.1 hypothetical protein [Verrucosispora sioxanthis]NGM13766.1 hypothetical protein [Verrucosispora sioxanthis]
MQGLLFVLGGLLLGTAATVFTAVAWASVGVAGRAVILLAFTALLLAVPLVARWRGLRGTAETFAAVGLLLVLLDGYAAWTVDLFRGDRLAGQPVRRPGGRHRHGGGDQHARLSRLAVPWFAALLVGQPLLPLLAAEARRDRPAGRWSSSGWHWSTWRWWWRCGGGPVSARTRGPRRTGDGWPAQRWPGSGSPVGCCSPRAVR